MLTFTVEKTDSLARLGTLVLPHGTVSTPCFMPVGTQGSVKTLTPAEVMGTGAEMIVCNTYHLYLRPGHGRVQAAGGLSKFIGWDRPILTDSGGFQVYSLAALTRVTDRGAEFQSHVDGSRHLFTPELVVEIQEALGPDIAMCLDECPPYPISRPVAEAAAARTSLWAERCCRTRKPETNLFGIVQGATYADLREESARALVALDLPGYAIGGLCLGEASNVTYEMVGRVTPLLPAERPRYLMGAGYPEDIVASVRLGIDMFDCVLPTRNGRTGTAFTASGRVAIRNSKHADESGSLDAACDCYTCRTFSRAYLRHLFVVGEALGPKLLTLHNISFFQRLMQGIRAAIGRGEFESWTSRFLSRYRTGADPAEKEKDR
ncbi:tRNA guanosine(34) transglycosylase Tgt [candidate division WOR-3 bacterium]|nr:tRNA guanosine(34) transglycosylase Tgt [candidate division WOR-3 bacterium]